MVAHLPGEIIKHAVLFLFAGMILFGGWVLIHSREMLWEQPFPLPTLASTASIAAFATQQAAWQPTPLTSRPTNPPTHTPPSKPTSTPEPTLSPLPPTVTPTATHVYEVQLTPGEPQAYLSKFRLVAFYGSPVGRGLGILGNQSRSETLTHLLETVAQYEPLSDRPILPAYHMVITVANRYPPYYHHHIGLDVIEEWVEAAKAENVAVILDIQPGRGVVMSQYNRIRHLLYEPHVHVAIDPEFAMAAGEVPATVLGQLYASQINDVQADLNEIGRQIGLNRVLILHQFANSMLPDKAFIEDYPYVELVIDGDGFGSPAAKIRNYTQYAGEHAFEYGGFKLFPRDGDYPLLTPAEVMALEPQPVIIIYQ